MKKSALLLFVCLLLTRANILQAQNTFPSSGSVGIGTTTPADQLEIVNTTTPNRKVGFNPAISGAAPGGIISFSRPDDGVKIMMIGGAAATTDDGVVYTSGGSSELRLVSAGGSSSGFGFYSNITAAQAFGSSRPTPIFKIQGDGKVGIGNSAPERNFQVDGGSGGSSMMLGNTTTSSRTSLWLSTDGSAGKATIQSWWAGVNQGVLSLNPNGGNVGIGTANPNQLLTVKGTIYGKEVIVDINVPGPDYVFEKSYELKSLSELKSYIEENKHLPEVPSATEMEKEGIHVSEMNMLLLKKVEELTLYLIQQKDEMAAVKSELEMVKKSVAK